MDEIMELNNVPLFNRFDFDNKFNITEKDNMIFIKILFSDIDNWDNILSKIFNKNIIIYPENLTKNKHYLNLYNEFKELYKLPIEYLNILKNNTSFKIYNTPEQQKAYIDY